MKIDTTCFCIIYYTKMLFSIRRVVVLVAVWLSGSVVGHINEVTLWRAWLMLRWVTVCGYTILVFNQATQAN